MDKNSIDRKALRYNFLKKIIIRFDYDGMDDTELEFPKMVFILYEHE